MVFAQAWEGYRNNSLTALGFALLLIFVFPFSWLANSFISSGTAIIDYGFLRRPAVETILLLALALLFLFCYSALVCLMVFAVRADFNRMRVHYFLNEKLLIYAWRYFQFVALFTLIAAVLSSVLLDLGAPPVGINILLMAASLPFLFLAQTIVVDGESLGSSALGTLDFVRKNPQAYVFAFAFGFAAVTILEVVEFFIDKNFSGGGFVSLFVALVFLVPFFEALKTELYMGKFSLVSPYRSAEGFRRMGSR